LYSGLACQWEKPGNSLRAEKKPLVSFQIFIFIDFFNKKTDLIEIDVVLCLDSGYRDY